MDIDAIRKRISLGIEPWKTLDELDEGHELRRWLADEFPDRKIPLTLSRRDVLRLISVSAAVAGLTGCRGIFMSQRHLVPYVSGPAEQTYGQQVKYRSALVRHGYGLGVEVATRDGRPIKVEGNPDHPASLGAADAIAQASLLQFYDPDRSRVPVYSGQDNTWEAFVAMAQNNLGRGLRILTETVTSPTLARQIAALKTRVPETRWHAYEPINRDATFAASRLAFSRSLAPVYKMQDAEVVVGIDFDLDRPELGRVADARCLGGADRRIYSVSCTPTLMGNVADHCRALSPSNIYRFTNALAKAVGVNGISAEVGSWTQAIAQDLLRTRGRNVVAVGETQPANVQALGYAINAALDNLGHTLHFVEPVESSPLDQSESLTELVRDMRSGQVGFLLILGANPAYHAPGEADFAEALAHVPFKAHHGLYRDETGLLCDWHLPATHEFEAWSDVRAFDGTYSVVQPQLQPLFDSRSAHEVVSMLGDDRREGRVLVRDSFGELSEEEWTEALRVGTFGKASSVIPKLRQDFGVPKEPEAETTVLFRPDPHLDDGRYANNGWLQETPKPHTGLVWDNAVLVSPQTAELYALANGNHLEVAVGDRSCIGPAWISPGHADDCVTLVLGFGRTAAGAVGDQVGFNVFGVRPLESPNQARAKFRKAEGDTDLVSTQSHHRMEGLDLIKSVSPGGSLEREPTEYGFHELTAKWDQMPGIPQWGMSIDLDRCIGCNACVVACQAENNIPVVGKNQVSLGREMHWIRIDRYYAGNDLDNPQTLLQPVTCMQCETAPCEPVCPVAATVHSHDGVNQMIYNRCVGTRYCSNNCPYKVRRFNYLNYQLLQPNFAEDRGIQLLRLLNNPDVTVRSRGVMEKCTYCAQRISSARITAEKEGRRIAEGEVVTACAQTCPTKAITFGDLTDPQSAVRSLRVDPREYPLLAEELTVPRTTYLARIHNPNKELPNA